jgi:hypothetical protein
MFKGSVCKNLERSSNDGNLKHFSSDPHGSHIKNILSLEQLSLRYIKTFSSYFFSRLNAVARVYITIIYLYEKK